MTPEQTLLAAANIIETRGLLKHAMHEWEDPYTGAVCALGAVMAAQNGGNATWAPHSDNGALTLLGAQVGFKGAQIATWNNLESTTEETVTTAMRAAATILTE